MITCFKQICILDFITLSITLGLYLAMHPSYRSYSINLLLCSKYQFFCFYMIVALVANSLNQHAFSEKANYFVTRVSESFSIIIWALQTLLSENICRWFKGFVLGLLCTTLWSSVTYIALKLMMTENIMFLKSRFYFYNIHRKFNVHRKYCYRYTIMSKML